MPVQSSNAATNAQIVRLLESISSDLAETKKQQERIARDVERLLKRETA